MKILIIGTPRSGTTSLIRGIGNQNYFSKGEPYNYRIGPNMYNNTYPLKEVSEYEKIVVKTLAQQVPKEKEGTDPIDFGVEFCSYFDKIILLDRLIWKSHWESFINLHRLVEKKQTFPINKEKYQQMMFGPWIPNSLTNKDFEWAYQKNLDKVLKEDKKIIAGISEKLNIPITYYEKLYSEDRMEAFEIINNWNLEDIDPFDLLHLLDPLNKHRKESKPLI
jgi:hypothetical protein